MIFFAALHKALANGIAYGILRVACFCAGVRGYTNKAHTDLG
ncbi:MAG: hypothetical protein V7L22_27280 [Nostoc sp.]